MFNKKAMSVLIGTIIFMLVVIVFVSAMLYFVSRTANSTSIIEQIYAKKIALIIDQTKPGTNISLDISELYLLADKNGFDRLDVINYIN